MKKPSWSAVNYQVTCAHSCACWDLLAGAKPVNARLCISGSTCKKVLGSRCHGLYILFAGTCMCVNAACLTAKDLSEGFR